MMRQTLLTLAALSLLAGCKNNSAETENPDNAQATDDVAANGDGTAPDDGSGPRVRSSTTTTGTGDAGTTNKLGRGPRVKAAKLVAKQPPSGDDTHQPTARPTNTPEPVEIVGFFPPTAGVGSSIEIYGSNFSPTSSKNQVRIGDKKMRVLEAYADRLVVRVGSDVSGPVEVVKGKGFTKANRSEATTTAASFTAQAADDGFARKRTTAGHGLLGTVYDVGSAQTEIPAFGEIGDPVGYIAVDNLDIAPGQHAGINVGDRTLADNYGVHFQGSLNIGEAGSYEFCLNAGDGALLYLDQQVIVDGDGAGDPRETCETLAVEPGEYVLDLLWYQNSGPMGLQLTWAKDGGAKEAIPATAFFPPDVSGLAAAIEQAAAGG